MQFHRHLLSNGLRLLTIPMPWVESVTVLVMVGAGSRYENKNNNGISHFLEHLAFKGTKKRPTAMDISGLIDGMGGEFNAFTGKEYTGFYVKSAAKQIEVSLDVLSDMLMNSKLDEKELHKERGVILEEINLYEDTPARKIGDVFDELLYGDVPMGWDVAGTKDVVQKIQRKDFIKYMNTFYSADNITVVVAGGVNKDHAEKLVQNYFHKMTRFDIQSALKVLENQKKPKVLVKQKKTEQVHIGIGFRTVPLEHEDRYGLEVLAAILGGGMSSRLFNEVREKRGLAYYVRTSSDNYTDCGNLVTFSGVDPKRVDEAVKVIVEEYKKTASGQHVVTKKELKKAQEFLKGHLVLELEDSRAVASFYGHQELLEKSIDNPKDLIKKIDNVGLENIAKVAKKYFVRETLNLAVIGNFSDGQRFEKLLEL